MIYHGLFGMDFTEEGVRFAPVVPQQFKEIVLDNVRYRNCQLRIVVKGNGTRVQECKVDGKATKPFFAASQSGAHEIVILVR
jgi:hypothetical protein